MCISLDCESEIPEELVNLLQTTNVDLAHGAWKKQQLAKYGPAIHTWSVSKLQIQHNRHKSILWELRGINFACLEVLVLFGNELESLEGLGSTSMPALKNIYLGDNNLSNLRELRKVHWKELQRLSLSRNRLSEISSLSCLDSLYLQYLDIEHFSEDSEQCSDTQWLAKLASSHLNQIWISSRHRIGRKRIGSMLMKKYSHLKIKSKSII